MDEEQLLADLGDAIWYQMACRCEGCGIELELLDWERLRHRDPPAWSRLAAKRAFESGWTAATDRIALHCSACSFAANDKPSQDDRGT